MPMSGTFFIAMVAFFLVMLTLVFRFEKRMVWPYAELAAQPDAVTPYGYLQISVERAVAAGFKFLGWSRDLKGGNYKITYAFLISPDRTTLAVIGEGTILSLKIAGSWLHTPTTDGKSSYSTDNQAGVQIDLSRNWTNQLCLKAPFHNLWARHQQWIQEMRLIPRTFRDGHEFEEFKELRRQHYRHMAQAGLIQYLDPSGTQFQFTTLGAARTASWGYFLGLARGLTAGRFPKNA
jgi:hypothetical protein